MTIEKLDGVYQTSRGEQAKCWFAWRCMEHWGQMEIIRQLYQKIKG
jgi:hypothetical protein